MRTSIIDTPRKASENDTFGIDPYQKGLIEFAMYSATPITIALQGEWGSGKTSLMNTLENDLCGKGGTYHSIWLNTWEYALMKDAETALVGILSGLIEQMMDIFEQEKSKTKKMLFNLGKAVGKIATNVAVTQANKVMESSGDAFKAFSEHFSSETASTIGSLRTELEQVIETCIEKDDQKGIVFFIDDLDRIDPPVAVQLLELLKNIFALKNCIFILAIDYDVVIKGLEPKFGKFCEANEREFRSFFDKIIQLPFSMPVSSYNIDKFLTDNLKTIEYLTETQANNKELASFITCAANFTVGNNPRALKRLLNSLSLINCINRAKSSNEKDKEDADPDLALQVNFALVSLQVAYPAIYRMVVQKPHFDQWNEQTALEFNLKRLSEDQVQKINTNEEFDESWEQVVFQACEADLFLRKKSLWISRHLNALKALIESKEENVGDIVRDIISLSSITSLEAFDNPIIDYHRGNLLKHARHHLIEALKQKLPDIKDLINPQGKRVQTNAYIKLSEKDGEHCFHLYSHPQDRRIRLRINTGSWIMSAQTLEEAESRLKTLGYWDELTGITDDFKSLITKYDPIGNPFGSGDTLFFWKDGYHIRMDIFADLVSQDDLQDNSAIKDVLGITMAEIYNLRLRIDTLKGKIAQAGG